MVATIRFFWVKVNLPRARRLFREAYRKKEAFQVTKYPCELVKDLVPIYVEGEVNDETRKIIEQHFNECADCQELFQEYQERMLLLQGTKETLPQADIFKTWIKRLKKVALVSMFIIVLGGIAIGIVSYQAATASKEELLSLREVTDTFATGGLSLATDQSALTAGLELGGVAPQVFKIGQSQDTVYIYVFESVEERVKEFSLYEEEKYQTLFASGSNPVYFYEARNCLLVYSPDEFTHAALKTNIKISDLAFYKLNGGKDLIFKGEGSEWEGQITLSYYLYTYQDERGRTHYVNWHYEKPLLIFKGNPEDIDKITFSYETTGGGGAGEIYDFNKDGRIELGRGGGNGAMPTENDVYTFTVEWNGKKETFDLKAPVNL